MAADQTEEHGVITSVWDGHNDEDYRRDQSHWRGVGRWADDKAWQAIGLKTQRNLDLACRISDQTPVSDRSDISLLEWGPGGGANAFAFRNIARDYFGVDISSKNLAEAERVLVSEGSHAFKPILLDEGMDTIKGAVSRPIDAFLSTAVFQHFPNKEYGFRVLRMIRSICSSDAVGSIQIRFDNGDERYAGHVSLQEYREKHIVANSYRLDEFWALCLEARFMPLAITNVIGTNNYATFLLKVR